MIFQYLPKCEVTVSNVLNIDNEDLLMGAHVTISGFQWGPVNFK